MAAWSKLLIGKLHMKMRMIMLADMMDLLVEFGYGLLITWHLHALFYKFEIVLYWLTRLIIILSILIIISLIQKCPKLHQRRPNNQKNQFRNNRTQTHNNSQPAWIKSKQNWSASIQNVNNMHFFVQNAQMINARLFISMVASCCRLVSNSILKKC